MAAFRAEIQKKTSLNVFKQLQQQSQQQPGKGHIVKKVKGQETYPEPLQRERLRERRKNPRYKTLPVSLRELGNIREMESLKPQRSVPDDQSVEVEVEMTFVADDPQTDEDFDTLVEINAQELTEEQSEEMLSFTFTLDVPVGDKCEMSVGDKLSMFRRLDEEAPKTIEIPKKTTQSSHAKSLLDRRKRLLRHRTLPVTDDEVKQASVLATGEGNQVQTDQSASEKEAGSDDELSKYTYFLSSSSHVPGPSFQQYVISPNFLPVSPILNLACLGSLDNFSTSYFFLPLLFLSLSLLPCTFYQCFITHSLYIYCLFYVCVK